MEVKVQEVIKNLSTLEEKVQAIAINGYVIEKRELDKKLADELTKIEVQYRKQYEPFLNEVQLYAIKIHQLVAGKVDMTDADLEGVEDLLTEQ